MDSDLGYRLSPTLSQQQQKHSIIISHRPNKPLAQRRRHVEQRLVQHPQTTTPTIESTKEKATIKMDNDCIDSNGEATYTKKKSVSAGNVPVSVSEEEEWEAEEEATLGQNVWGGRYPIVFGGESIESKERERDGASTLVAAFLRNNATIKK